MGKEMIFGRTIIPESKKSKPLYFNIELGNVELYLGCIPIYDARHYLPLDFENKIESGVDYVLLPSMTAFCVGPELNVQGKIVKVIFPNTNPDYIARDKNGSVDYKTLSSVQVPPKKNPFAIDHQAISLSKEDPIHSLFSLVPHPIIIVDKNEATKAMLPSYAHSARAFFVKEGEEVIETEHGPLIAMNGKNIISPMKIPGGEMHDGLLISMNMYAILKCHEIIGSPQKLAKVFGRSNFSLLVVNSTPYGITSLLRVEVVPKIIL